MEGLWIMMKENYLGNYIGLIAALLFFCAGLAQGQTENQQTFAKGANDVDNGLTNSIPTYFPFAAFWQLQYYGLWKPVECGRQ